MGRMIYWRWNSKIITSPFNPMLDREFPNYASLPEPTTSGSGFLNPEEVRGLRLLAVEAEKLLGQDCYFLHELVLNSEALAQISVRGVNHLRAVLQYQEILTKSIQKNEPTTQQSPELDDKLPSFYYPDADIFETAKKTSSPTQVCLEAPSTPDKSDGPSNAGHQNNAAEAPDESSDESSFLEGAPSQEAKATLVAQEALGVLRSLVSSIKALDDDGSCSSPKAGQNCQLPASTADIASSYLFGLPIQTQSAATTQEASPKPESSGLLASLLSLLTSSALPTELPQHPKPTQITSSPETNNNKRPGIEVGSAYWDDPQNKADFRAEQDAELLRTLYFAEVVRHSLCVSACRVFSYDSPSVLLVLLGN